MPTEKGRIQGQSISPELLVQEAIRHRCTTIAYTYTEPAVYFDYAHDTAQLAQQHGLKNIFVTNGYLSEEALNAITPFLDGANIDLKAFRNDSYLSVCGARLQPVLDTIRRLKDAGIWIEVTTLLIPGMNDSEDEIRDIARFIRDIDPGIPWHISRFHPTYRMTDRPATPVETVKKACEIGDAEGLRMVYAGNIPGDERESTTCYGCGTKLITRWGFEVVENRLEAGRCTECGTCIDGIWSSQ
jgi:pyruvate formate lyase activating enzyme